MTQTNMTSFKQTHTNENNSYNKPFTIRIQQIFSSVPWKQHSLSKSNIFSVKLKALLLSLKAQKTQDDSWFYCKEVQEMPLRTLPRTAVYWGQVDKGEVLSRHRYKETRIVLINTIAFSEVEVKLSLWLHFL